MSWMVGCDTGGTFTDVCAVSDAGELRVAKVPSTPPQFEAGVLEALSRLRIPPADVVTLFHGTTVTTNAVITKSGAPSALLTTAGFRDVLEIGRANRGDLYDILWDPPEPLITRRDRLEVVERINYAGAVVTPLDEQGVRSAAQKIRARGLSSVAVCFLNAYANPSHERRARDILSEEVPEIAVSLSTDILPEPPEFERTATTAANAYCAPVLRVYMEALELRLAEAGYSTDVVLVMHNGGGTMTPEYARGVAVKTLNSGPAAGVIGATAIGAACGRANLVSLDIGGTSAEIAVIQDGSPHMTTTFDLDWGMPIRFPSIDVTSIGAGGGSIAWLDAAGYLKSGPASAGAHPGPVCYGRGGRAPTSTDAQLLLGRLSSDVFLQGRMHLDEKLAGYELERALASKLGVTTTEAAAGILRVTNATMVRALRLATVERGFDPREFALVAFGGAGPLHAVEVARELGMREVIIPPFPGVTSAMGLLFVDPLDDFSWAYVRPVDDVNVAVVQGIFATMEDRVASSLVRQGVTEEAIEVERSVDLRYVGQLHSVTVPIGEVTREGFESAASRFHDGHHRQYRYSARDRAVETSTLRVTARGRRSKPDLQHLQHSDRAYPPLPTRERRVYFDGDGWLSVPVVDRNSLAGGQVLSPPCLIEELDTTVVVPPGVTAAVDDCGNILIAELGNPARSV